MENVKYVLKTQTMAQNSETRNIGYEKHPLFKYYEENCTDCQLRCIKCGSYDLYHRYPDYDNGIDATLKCNECETKTDLDHSSFVEWCEDNGYDPNTNVIIISKDTETDIISKLVQDMDENSPRIIIQGENFNEDI